MFRLIFRVLVAAAGLWLAARIVPGVTADGWKTLLIAGFLLGIVNAVVRPVVTLLTFPLTIVTLGLFLLVVNAAMIGLVAWLLDGLAVHGLLAGVEAAIVTGVVSWVGHLAVGDARRERE
ncbi:phage holin family protein [uncultured Caulobacter sp.]|uniref:phage holin family protein n=1 Tax=uncultured Caulobacter sp. TaxID=158749 RepID=UPI0026238297|nr:phage holin family protein [uncultured Caulobacter sp.]